MEQLQIHIVPPTGAKLVAARAWFGVRFAYLRDHPPTNEAGQRRAITRIAKALMPYVRGTTTEQLVAIFLHDPPAMVWAVQRAIGSPVTPQPTAPRVLRGKPRR